MIGKNKYLQKAVDEAWKYQFLTYPNPAVGACVVQDGTILSCEAHHEAGLPHAEVNALKEAYLTKYPNSKLKDIYSSKDIHNYLINNHNNFFRSLDIYVTLEPCNHIGKTPACAMLLESIGIKKVIIGVKDPNIKASGGVQRLENANIDVEVLDDADCKNLLYPFIKWQEDKFLFYKIAMRGDGSIDGGYITTQDSLNLVHNIRTKLDLMIISGKTVRDDRPTLDSRFSQTKKAPDIFIYSRQKDYDKTIPLFKIPKRKVIISDNFKDISEKFIMIEGGYSLLKNIVDEIDMLMVFVSYKDKSIDRNMYIFNSRFKIIHRYFLNSYDEIIYFKII